MSQTQPHPKNVLKNQLTRHAGCVIVIKVLRTMPKTVGAAKRNEESPTEERKRNFDDTIPFCFGRGVFYS